MAIAVALAGAGCGGSKEEAASEMPAALAKPADFPKAQGKTLAQLQTEVKAKGPVLAPSVYELAPGKNRFGFGLFDLGRKQIADAPTAVYVAPAKGGPARGPFVARYESLAVKPQFQSRNVASDPDSAQSLYVAEPTFPGTGSYRVMGVAKLDGRLVAATPAGPPLKVSANSPVPKPGDPAPRTHTPTRTDVGGDVAKIETRQPPSTMLDVDFADVLGRKPAVLVFSTPALCQSRVCGPVLDVAEQVKAQRGGDADFVHMEIYRDNQLDKGFRPQVLQWRLRTEPWVFTVNRSGRIAARLEGAFSARELNEAIDAAVKG